MLILFALPTDIKDTIKLLSQLSILLTNSNQEDLTRMLIGTYNDFVNVVKAWKQQYKIPKTHKKANTNHNPIIITPKLSSSSTTITTTTTTTSAPSVTCPVCNNILIGMRGKGREGLIARVSKAGSKSEGERDQGR